MSNQQMPRTKSYAPSPQVNKLRDEIIAVLKKHENNLSAMEVLAILAHLTGQSIAFQDREKMTPQMAMDLVSQNITQGNAEAVFESEKTQGTA